MYLLDIRKKCKRTVAFLNAGYLYNFSALSAQFSCKFCIFLPRFSAGTGNKLKVEAYELAR